MISTDVTGSNVKGVIWKRQNIRGRNLLHLMKGNKENDVLMRRKVKVETFRDIDQRERQNIKSTELSDNQSVVSHG